MSKGEIGFVGLGRMGFPMARNLAQAGYAVHVHDVAAGAMERAGRVAGITPGASAREVAARRPSCSRPFRTTPSCGRRTSARRASSRAAGQAS